MDGRVDLGKGIGGSFSRHDGVLGGTWNGDSKYQGVLTRQRREMELGSDMRL